MAYETKQVIVIRKDLNMRKGKMSAQASHASIAFLTRRLGDVNQHNDGSFKPKYIPAFRKAEAEWLSGSFAKIVVGVDSEEELDKIYEAAKEAGLEVHLITDSGATEFHGVPTKTCLAIGPDYSEKIDRITGHLKLL